MTDISAALPRPKIPIWRTAYDGYRLGIGAIFSSGAMFRYFVYGSVSVVTVMGVLFYGSLTMSGLVGQCGVTERTLALVVGSSFVLGIALSALIAAMQTPMGVADPKVHFAWRVARAFILRIFDQQLWPSVFLGIGRGLCVFLVASFVYVSVRSVGLRR